MRSKPVESVAGCEKLQRQLVQKATAVEEFKRATVAKQMRKMTHERWWHPVYKWLWQSKVSYRTHPLSRSLTAEAENFRRLADRARTESHSAIHFSHLVCFRLDSVEQPSSSSCPGASQHQTLHWTVQFTPICYRFESLVCYFLRWVFGLYSPLRYFLFCVFLPIGHW